MIADRTQFRADALPENRKPLREAIEAAVSVSAGKYNADVTREHPGAYQGAGAASGRRSIRPCYLRGPTGSCSWARWLGQRGLAAAFAVAQSVAHTELNCSSPTTAAFSRPAR
jgi:hypothetical protein